MVSGDCMWVVMVSDVHSQRRYFSTRDHRQFVVSDLDAHHCVAIATKPAPDGKRERPHFREISFTELVGASAPDTHALSTATKSMSL